MKSLGEIATVIQNVHDFIVIAQPLLLTSANGLQMFRLEENRMVLHAFFDLWCCYMRVLILFNSVPDRELVYAMFCTATLLVMRTSPPALLDVHATIVNTDKLTSYFYKTFQPCTENIAALLMHLSDSIAAYENCQFLQQQRTLDICGDADMLRDAVGLPAVTPLHGGSGVSLQSEIMYAAAKYRDYVIFGFLSCPEMLLDNMLFPLFQRVGSRALVVTVFRAMTLSFHPEFETIGAQYLSWKVLGGKEKSQKALRHVAKTAVLTAGLVMRQRRGFILSELSTINAMLRLQPAFVAPKLPQILAAASFAKAELVAFMCHCDLAKETIRRDTRKHFHPNRYMGTDVAALLSQLCTLVTVVKRQEETGAIQRYYSEELVSNDLRLLEEQCDRCCERVPSVGSMLEAIVGDAKEFRGDLDAAFGLRSLETGGADGGAGMGDDSSAMQTPSKSLSPNVSKSGYGSDEVCGSGEKHANPFDSPPADFNPDERRTAQQYYRPTESTPPHRNLQGLRASWEALVSLTLSPTALSLGFGLIPAAELRSPPFLALFNCMLHMHERTLFVDSLSSLLLKEFAIPYELWWFSESFARTYREGIDSACNPLIDPEPYSSLAGSGAGARAGDPLHIPLTSDQSSEHSLAFFHVLSYNALNVHPEGPPSEDTMIAIGTTEVCDLMVDDWVGYFASKVEALVANIALVEAQATAPAAAKRLASAWGYADGGAAQKNKLFQFRRSKSNGGVSTSNMQTFVNDENLPGLESARAIAAERGVEELILLKRCLAGMVASVSRGCISPVSVGDTPLSAGTDSSGNSGSNGVIALYNRRYDLTALVQQRLLALFEDSIRSILLVHPATADAASAATKFNVLSLGGGAAAPRAEVASFSERLQALTSFCHAAQYVMGLFPAAGDSSGSTSANTSAGAGASSHPITPKRNNQGSAAATTPVPGPGADPTPALSSPPFNFRLAFRSSILRQYTLTAVAAVPALTPAGAADVSPGSGMPAAQPTQGPVISEIALLFRQAVLQRSAFVWLPQTREFSPLPKSAVAQASGSSSGSGSSGNSGSSIASLFAGKGGGGSTLGGLASTFPLHHHDLVSLCAVVGPPGVKVMDDELLRAISDLAGAVYVFVAANKAVLLEFHEDFKRGGSINPLPFISSMPLMTASLPAEASASSGTFGASSVSASLALAATVPTGGGGNSVVAAGGYTDKISLDALTVMAAVRNRVEQSTASKIRGLGEFVDALVTMGTALAARDALHLALSEAVAGHSPGLSSAVRGAERVLRAAGVDPRTSRGAASPYTSVPERMDVVLAAVLSAAASAAAGTASSGSFFDPTQGEKPGSRGGAPGQEGGMADFAVLFPVAAALAFAAPRWEDCMYVGGGGGARRLMSDDVVVFSHSGAFVPHRTHSPLILTVTNRHTSRLINSRHVTFTSCHIHLTGISTNWRPSRATSTACSWQWPSS